jgi:hypothetical protein
MTTTYEWSHDWRSDDDTSLAMAHTGLAVTRDGRLVTGAASEPSLVISDRIGDGAVVCPVDGMTELHDLTLVEEDGVELIWVADTATKFYGGETSLRVHQGAAPGSVLQIDLDGNATRHLPPPDLSVYEDTIYSPTSVAVDEIRFGGGGDMWVADGYGASLVHHYDADGRHLCYLTGEEGAGRFAQPHGLLIDRRGPIPELLITDRLNARIQVYGLDGRFRRVMGADALPGPTQLAISGDTLVVTDLLAGRVSVFDADDRLIAHLFGHPSPPTAWDALPDGWPLARCHDGGLGAVALQRGAFHTPHGIAVDAAGTIYVSEFAIGGRVAALKPT